MKNIKKHIKKKAMKEMKNKHNRTFNEYNYQAILNYETADLKYEMPFVKAFQRKIDVNKMISFNCAKQTIDLNQIVHFYIDDYQFERIYRNTDKYVNILAKFRYVIAPDFSMYQEMPLPLMMFNNFRGKLLAQIWQKAGVNVIPNLVWSNKKTFDFAFKGLEKKGVYFTSNIGCVQNKTAFGVWIDGISQAIQELSPIAIHVYCYSVKKTGVKDIDDLLVFHKKEF